MQSLIINLLVMSFVLVLVSCNSHYPEGMSRADRKKYYNDYTKAYAGKNLAVAPGKDATVHTAKAATDTGEVNLSVPFSIQNNSLLPQKIEINGNVLKFNPLEVRYVGFAAGTKAYLYDKDAGKERGKFLFEVREKDRDRRLKLFN